MIGAWRLQQPGPWALRAALLGGAVALLLAPALPAGRAAAADAGVILLAQYGSRDNWDDDWGDAWDDYNRTIERMRRGVSPPRRSRRARPSRAVRRDELEKDRAQSAVAREDYFQAVLEASQASLRAPRGVYYRRPGHTSPEPPAGDSAGHRGRRRPVRLRPGGLLAAAGPGLPRRHGARRRRGRRPSPRRHPRPRLGEEAFWYFFGAFFAERGGAYAVVRPPAGLTVFYLPDGYTREKAGDIDVFRFGDTLFKPVFVQGIPGLPGGRGAVGPTPPLDTRSGRPHNATCRHRFAAGAEAPVLTGRRRWRSGLDGSIRRSVRAVNQGSRGLLGRGRGEGPLVQEVGHGARRPQRALLPLVHRRRPTPATTPWTATSRAAAPTRPRSSTTAR